MPADRSTFLARMRRAGYALCRQPQHRLDAGAAQHVNQFIHGELGLLDKCHHRQQRLPIPGQKTSQRLCVVLVDRVI